MNPDLEHAGALVTEGLVAHEIDHHVADASGSAPLGALCGNCGAASTGAYCQRCGQSAHLHHSLLHLAEEILHGVLHFDAKGWRTLPLLAGRPGLLTRRYIDGQRTRYVSPLALFLFCVFLMFFVFSTVGTPSMEKGAPEERAQTAAGLQQERQKIADAVAHARADLDKAQRGGDADAVAEAKESLDSAQLDERVLDKATAAFNAVGSAGAPKSANADEDLSAGNWKQWLAREPINTGHPAFDANLHEHLQNPDLFLYKLKNTAYKFSFMLIPISLPFLWLLFIGRGVPMYDHAIFSLYSLSFMSLLFVALALLGAAGAGGAAALLVTVGPPLHVFLQVRETYGLGVFAAAWRTVALLAVAGTAFLLFLLFIVMMTLH